MKEMKKALKIGLFGLLAHIYASTALAATGTSGEFKIDLVGMGPWEMRTAAASESISYSTAWATNLTAAQQASANAVVKVYPVKREKPKYIAIDLSGGTAATHYPIEYLEDVPDGGWTDEYKTTKLVLRHIPAGSFIMGGRNTDYPGAVNTNLHEVARYGYNSGWWEQDRQFSVRAASADFLNCSSPDMGNWTMLCVKYSGNHVTAYTNGALAASATLDATATDNQMSRALGGFQGKDASTSLNGQYDEIRLRGGSLSPDRIKADYDMIVNRNFLRYGPVENGKGEAE